MSEISSVNTSTDLRLRRVSVDPANAIDKADKEDVRARGGARPSDQVELSSVAQYLSQLKSEPAERTDLIERVKAQIEAGEYLTNDKLDAATDHLLEDINFEL